MSKPIVLITGVNGFIAARAADHFLTQGYTVRGTVRKTSSASALISGPFAQYHANNSFQVVEVPDITVPGAFDTAVKGVSAILHLASPVSFNFTDPVPIIHAAVEGTRTILNSAHQHAGPQLTSFVLMSSIAAVWNQTPAPYTFTEKDWNDFAEKVCEEKGKETPGPVIYSASKAAGEKALWAWKEEVKPGFRVASVNPVFVIGPQLIVPKTPDAVGGTIQSIWRVFSGEKDIQLGPGFGAAVDVRDVAQLLRYMVEHADETDGERYIASAAMNHPQALADILREGLKDDAKAVERIAVGTPGVGYKSDFSEMDGQNGIKNDSSKARVLLDGKKWIDFRKSVLDTAETFAGLV